MNSIGWSPDDESGEDFDNYEIKSQFNEVFNLKNYENKRAEELSELTKQKTQGEEQLESIEESILSDKLKLSSEV